MDLSKKCSREEDLLSVGKKTYSVQPKPPQGVEHSPLLFKMVIESILMGMEVTSLI